MRDYPGCRRTDQGKGSVGGPDLSAEACEAAQGIGTGVGIALILGVWITVDFILGITYLIFRKK
ncbi:hypothetical protein [Pseudonocardia parietis]|uniref:Uncharacterized protein n=1 Tax=Pseudonocardia parietis TaxID=570936 RepID=A0ABS4VSD8_9PSEU|nr:hypothetical protein [Pseudonocardia parietis]MBP2366474.1 hypothetical protein [Pseudonocardia parietis]